MANTKVTGDVIANGTISTVHLADDAITAAKLDSTATGITFADLTVDTNTLYVDAANNRVGIGETSPSTKVEIKQTNNDIYQLTLYNNHISTTSKARIGNWNDEIKISSNYMQSGGTKTQDNTANSSWVMSMGAAGDAFDISRSPAASTTLSSLMRIDSSGRVGIGTDSPDARFSVVTATANSTASRIGGLEYSGNQRGLTIKTFQSAGGDDCGVEFNAAEGLSGYGSFIFKADTSERMRIDSSGDVLMGNTVVNPASGFASQRGFGYDNSTGNLQAASTSGTAMTIGRNEASDGTIIELRKESNVVGTLGSNTTSGQMLLDISGSSSNGNIRFVTNGAEAMRITSSYNVGIGTASPSSRLQVKDSQDSSFDSGIGIIRSASSQTGYINMVGGAFNFNAPSGVPIRFRDGGTANVTIDGSGNVGIGTTSPDASLDIEPSSGDADILLTAGSQTLRLDQNSIRTTANHNLSIFTNGNSGQLVLQQSTGNIGIGTTAPSEALHIYRNAASAEIRLQNNTISSYIRSSTDNLNFWVSNGEKMRITSAGNVGIGTTSPSQLLNLSGNTNSYTTAPLIRFDSTSTANVNIRNWAIGPADSNYGNFHIYKSITRGGDPVGATQASTFTIDYNGNVGINEMVPAAKLQVSGDRDGNSEYVAVLGEDGGANGAANSANTTPVHKTLLTGYSIPYGGQTNARLTSAGFLEFDSTPGWTGNQRNWALTSGYDIGGTNGPKFAILMGNTQNVEPQLGTNGGVGTGTGDGVNTRVAAYWKNTGDMVVPEGGLFVKGRITGDTDNANNNVNYLRTISIPYSGNTGSFTFDIDPVAEFGTRVSGGRMKLEVSGWGQRLSAGYIVYRNDGTGSGKIGTGDVIYYRYAWSESSSSSTVAIISVSLVSSSTNVIRISFSGWHSNDHGFEARLTATS